MVVHALSNAIYERLSTLRSGSLSFYGQWFGRPYDNFHRITGAWSFEDSIVIYFDQAETLIIEAPSDWSLDDGKLLVREAARVQFQWFYYGRAPSRETLHFQEYRRAENGLRFTTNWEIDDNPQLDASQPAVQLHTIS